MRGILECWIKQAHRVELFKQRQSNQHALHSKFHLHTGEEIYTDDVYNHLQIDVVSIYLIFLVQMITSGLQIIYTQVWIRICPLPVLLMKFNSQIDLHRMKWHLYRISCITLSVHTVHQILVCGNVDPSTMTAHQKFTHRRLEWPNRHWKQSMDAIYSAKRAPRGVLFMWTLMRITVIEAFSRQCYRVNQAQKVLMHR